MDFAKKLMEKYGWKDGEGLGKEGNEGIVVAVKPHYKSGKEGMGFDLSKDLVDPWWSRAYADSLSRINVEAQADKVVVTTPEDDPQSALRPMDNMRKRMLKANFTDFSKGSTLSNGEMIDEEHDIPLIETDKIRQLSDTELLQACGGRTAHKGARFGLKLSGKLARIAAQEQMLHTSTSVVPDSVGTPETQGSKKKSKRHKRKTTDDSSEVFTESLQTHVEEIQDNVHRKKKKCNKSKMSVQTEDISQIAISDNSEPCIKKKKHKRKHSDVAHHDD